MDSLDMPLPFCRHVPGVNARPDEAFFAPVKAAALSRTSSEDAAVNPAWLYGLRLFNAGYYWETHEVLEVVWMNAAPNSRERHLVQGVIHMANALLKIEMDRPNACRRLVGLARQAFAEAFPSGAGRVMSLDGAGLLRAVEQLHDHGETALFSLKMEYNAYMAHCHN